MEALEHDTLGLPVGECANPEDWWTEDPQVSRATDTLGPIVDEAIFQRDLASALAKLGQPGGAFNLSDAERDAYADYTAAL